MDGALRAERSYFINRPSAKYKYDVREHDEVGSHRELQFP